MEEKKLDDEFHGVKQRVFFAARDGMSLTLFALLYDLSMDEVDNILNQEVCCDGVRSCALIVAARHGRENAVKILLEKFMPPLKLETEGTVKFDEYVIEGATALWCAAGAGHLAVVKRLVRAGADADHATRTRSTPLRAACFDGRLDIVRYLVRHGADLHKPNKYNNTCLMIAAYKGHLEVVQFLLEKGAQVNTKANCGATALHFAAECGHVGVVKALLDHGAKLSRNDGGMTALQCAAERARADVVELLVQRDEVTREDAIDAIELLGASFANDKEYYNLGMAYQYLHRAMAMRYDPDHHPYCKVPSTPIPAYDNWRECTNLMEIEALRGSPHSLHMEGLAVRERLLGRASPDLPHSIVFRGAVFADEARFDRCLGLWAHALALRQDNQVTVVKDLLRFAQVFSQMIHIGLELPLEQVVTVVTACSLELQRGREKLSSPQSQNSDPDLQVEEYESNVRTALYLVSLAARLIEKETSEIQATFTERGDGTHHHVNGIRNDRVSPFEPPETVRLADAGVRIEVGDNLLQQPKHEDYRSSAIANAHSAVFSLRKMKLRNGQTLLHLAVDASTPVDDFHTSDVCQFPCARTARLLITCGADVNAFDDRMRTPLHTAVEPSQTNAAIDVSASDEAISSVVKALIEGGAHLDVVDERGITPLAAATGGPGESLLRLRRPLRLSCACAAALRGRRARYRRAAVPRDLHPFLRAHGVHARD